MSEEKRSLKQVWGDLSPGMRLASIGGGVVLVLIVGLVMMPGSDKPRRVPNQQPIKAEMLLPKAQDRTVEQLSGGLTATDKEVQRMKRDIDRLSSERNVLRRQVEAALLAMKKEEPTDTGISVEVLEEIQKLRSRLEEAEARQALGSPSVGYQPSVMPMEGPQQDQSAEEVLPPPVITVIGDDDLPAVDVKADAQPAPYIVANSMFEAELLNGMDAPTDQSARRNPVPAVMRIKTEAILPNMYNVSEIRECFISVGGYGDMSDERAKLRTEILSCVVPSEDPDSPPTIIESQVDGYVVGEDGRVGMRGRLVSKQGQLIARTLLAGVLSGIGDALKPQQVQGLDLNPSGTTKTTTMAPGTIAASGLAQGVSDTAKSVSDWYLKLADQMMPIVEIDAGRKVTVVLLKGVELK